MIFWTVQHKKVISMLLEDEIYYPDFKYGKKYAEMRKLYPQLLEEYNLRNGTDSKGLIFGFGKLANQSVDSYDEFRKFFKLRPDLSCAFNFWDKNHLVLKVDIKEKFDAIPIELNDFIKLNFDKTNDKKGICMLEEAEVGYSFEEDIIDIKKRFSSGEITENYCVQVHYSRLKLTDIVEVHPMFNYKTYGLKFPTDETYNKIHDRISKVID